MTESTFCKYPKNYNIYDKIAETTSGLRIDLKEIDIKFTLKTLSNQFESNYSLIDSENYGAGTQNTTFYACVADKEFTIHTTADDAFINGPDNANYQPKTVGKLQYFILPRPTPGEYVITSKSEQNYSLLIGAISNLKLDYGFSVKKTESKANTVYQPVKGRN